MALAATKDVTKHSKQQLKLLNRIKKGFVKVVNMKNGINIEAALNAHLVNLNNFIASLRPI